MEQQWKSHAIQSLTSSRLRTDQEIRSDPQLNLLNCLLCFISHEASLIRKVSFSHSSINSLVRTLHNFKALTSNSGLLMFFVNLFLPGSSLVEIISPLLLNTLSSFLILASVFAVKFYLNFWRKYLVCLMYLSCSCSPVLSSFKDYLKMQRKTLF